MNFNEHIIEIEEKIGYTFKDKALLRQSFTRTSYCNESKGKKEGSISNEVLEFFGDAILSAAIITRLVDEKTERCPAGIKTALSEGDFSNIRSKLADKRNLSKSTSALGLQRFLIMGEGDRKSKISDEPSVMEDLFESIIGAVYIDSDKDMRTVIRVVGGMLDTSLYLANKASTHSPKNALQEFCADKKRRLPTPVYKTLSIDGPEHKRIFVRAVHIGDRLIAKGTGKNQKEADTAAAKEALLILESESSYEKSPAGVEVLARIKAMATEKKVPSAEFKDKGETPDSTDYAPRFSVECRFMGAVSEGTGRSKQEARISAAEKLLCAIDKKERKDGQSRRRHSYKSRKNRKTI